jgi:fructosamine-3-kinase
MNVSLGEMSVETLMVPQEVHEWLLDKGFGEILTTAGVAGGCISDGKRIVTQSGNTFFLKTNPNSPPDMFLRESEGLLALSVTDGPKVPVPYLTGADFLLLEDLQPAPRAQDYWPNFGRRLAGLHNQLGSSFGFSADNFIGSTPQPNPWTEDGFLFFSQHRLLFQARLARGRGLLSRTGEKKVETLSARLRDFVPDQQPALIHGDLWSGNALSDQLGNPALIDPAAHYGWAEAELAMTELFGGFPAVFYAAYEAVRPLTPGYRERFPIYNLYHLLNHLNLFGGGYLGRVLGILDRFV